ncbi:uncharacterized protein VTP21DRAFT_1881 [Calcarisporiella thermophila]|uniref:uncharacterized protein n=1 Tax=Calcarisporiella thermophila TaxID=911321 RepID=UPI0037439983
MIESAVLIKQGAEARVFELNFFSRPAIAKERFPKTYRHPSLDQKLTTRRVTQEARSLHKCRRAGIDVPTPYFVDLTKHVIYMEKIIGKTVRDFLLNKPDQKDVEEVMGRIGEALAKMHAADVVHGDLTTSNLIVRDGNHSLAIIDFGLSYVSALVEDQAVDLYVLERAFLSTHPNSENMFASILNAYAKHAKQSKPVLKKLDEVRLRGRKRSMVG